jgi:hypothetical protein
MQNDENGFRRQNFTRSGLEREERGERRGRSPTRQFFGSMSSPIFPTMGDVHSQTVFTHELQTHDQFLDWEDYGAHSGPVSNFEMTVDGPNPPAQENRVPGGPMAANANRRRRRPRRRPSCPRGGVQRAANGAAWEVSRRYGASNVDGMDNEVAENDVREENFSLGQYAEQVVDRMQPEPENPALPIFGSHFISTIATTARNINDSPIDSSGVDNVQAILDSLQEKTQLYSTEELMANNSLSALAQRCARADQMSQAADLVYMLSCVELRAKVIRYVLFLFYRHQIELFVLVFPLRLLRRKPPSSKELNGQ